MNAQRMARVLLGMGLLLLPVAAWAQSSGASGSIAGTVRDTSGAVLPGVTVEAASPALIEKVRSVVTDSQGLYRIVDLRPGLYTVTFTLPGFATFKREGLDLSASFTANVNAEMRVGDIQETVTVSGATPVVDTQNVLQQRTLGREALDALPNTRTFGAYAMLIPGAVQAGGGGEQNVGGVGGNSSSGAGEFAIHGGRAGDISIKQEGMSLNMQGGGTGSNFSINHAAIQEVVVETSGISADTESGGVKLNVVPREGGNSLSGYFSLSGANSALQGENLSAEQTAVGLTSAELRQVHDVSGGLGGPIMRDRLWFYTAHRRWGSSNYAPGKFFAKDPHSPLFNVDETKPAYNDFYYRDHSVRLTLQAAQKHKFNINYGKQYNCQCFIRLDFELRTPEASANHKYVSDTTQVSWNFPATNRLLFEAGVTHVGYNQDNQPIPGVLPTDIAITEVNTGMQYRARANTVTGTNGNYSGPNGITAATRNTNENFAVNYVTGSHSFKTGVFFRQMTQTADRVINQGMDFNFVGGIPDRVRIFAQPYGLDLETTMNAFYAQDQWTVRRLTMNLGVRYDYFNGHIPETHLAAGPLVGARDFAEVKNAPNWKDVTPRIGAAYDLFGNGKTAVKGFIGRYLGYQGVGGFTATAAPVNLLVVSATRTWRDTNGNFMPDCDLAAPAANGECIGALNPSNFGQTRTPTSRIDDSVLLGGNARPANWQGSVSVQQELRPGVALNVGYFRTWFQNFTVTDNLPIAAGNYDPYCITVPTDSRLPGGGGNELCGFNDVRQAQFGMNNTLVTQADSIGKQSEVFNGIDVNLNARLARGAMIQGGLSTGATVTDNCFVNGDPSVVASGSADPNISFGRSPRNDAFCHVTPPWSATTQFKVAFVYPMVWDIQASAMYQNLPGLPISANSEFTNAQIAPSLKRNLSGNVARVALELIPPFTEFLDRRNQLDLRFSKTFTFGRTKLQGNFDLYNVFNANYTLTYNNTFGQDWLKPQTILLARLVKLGVNLSF